MGKIISIINQKGGVGKTTTAVNLAAELADKGHKTLLIDEDAQGNSTSGLSKDVKFGKDLYDVLLDDADAKEAAVKTAVKKLWLLPSSIDLAGAEIESAGLPEREFLLRKKLAAIKDSYDYILIDCPPSLNLLTLNAMAAADAVLVPLQCEFFALEGLTQLMRTIDMVKQSLNPALEIQGLVLTMYDRRNALSGQVAADVRAHFGDKVYDSVIPRNVRVSEAPSFGKPVLIYDLKCTGSQAYLKLARELVARERQRRQALAA